MITLLLLVRATYMYGVVLHTHPVRGESHIQRNTTGEVATLYFTTFSKIHHYLYVYPSANESFVLYTDDSLV